MKGGKWLMNTLNPILVQFLYRSAIESLPDKYREVYRFIERKEDELEMEAVNENHFIQLINEKSPFQEAASYFSLDLQAINDIMTEAQSVIDKKIVDRCKQIKWVDMSAVKDTNGTSKEWTYVFVS
jgi:hypothetical protein